MTQGNINGKRKVRADKEWWKKTKLEMAFHHVGSKDGNCWVTSSFARRHIEWSGQGPKGKKKGKERVTMQYNRMVVCKRKNDDDQKYKPGPLCALKTGLIACMRYKGKITDKDKGKCQEYQEQIASSYI